MEPTDAPRAHVTRMSMVTKRVALAGLAAGVGFAATNAIASATTSTPKTPTPAATTPRPMKGFGGPGRGHFAGRGAGGGTITALSGGTLTLRTLTGTETVNTTSSTVYMKEGQKVTPSDLAVGDVVHVRGTPDSTTDTPGTGTVTAKGIDIVEPSLGGRVTSVSGSTISLVGRDGVLLSVTTTPSTRYMSGRTSAASSAVTVGSFIRAEGTRNSLTQLTADVVRVLPAPGTRPAPGTMPPAPGTMPPAGSPMAPGTASGAAA